MRDGSGKKETQQNDANHDDLIFVWLEFHFLNTASMVSSFSKMRRKFSRISIDSLSWASLVASCTACSTAIWVAWLCWVRYIISTPAAMGATIHCMVVLITSRNSIMRSLCDGYSAAAFDQAGSVRDKLEHKITGCDSACCQCACRFKARAKRHCKAGCTRC